MGSTLVAATVDQDTMYVANVGDSRLYLFRGRLKPDHQGSFPGGGNGVPGEAGAEQRVLQIPEKHHHQGCGDPACGDRRFFEVSLKKDDCVLLCSDGLSNMAEESPIGSILAAPAVLKEKTSRLIQAANENGGKDNIAVILIEPQISEVGV